MCGILFTVNTSTYTAKLDDFMNDAFVTSMVRGMDSSGMFQVQNSYHPDGPRNVKTYKSVSEGAAFIQEQGARELINAACRLPVTVGHVRAATHGSVSAANAHPFITVREDGSRIVGVHNGSLNNWKSKTDGDKFEVDSQWLYHKLAKDGYDAFKEFDGAYALVWFDSRHPESLFVARNKHRPLFYTLTKDGDGLLACSELGMLGWLADRNSIELIADKNNNRFFYPEANHVFEFNIKDLKKWTRTKLPEYDSSSRRYDRPHQPSSVHIPTRYSDHRLSTQHVADVNYNVNQAWQLTAQNSKLRSIANALSAGRAKSNKGTNALLDNAMEAVLKAEAKELDEVLDGEQLEEALTQEIQDYLAAKHAGIIGDDIGAGGIGNASRNAETAIDEAEFQYVSAPPSASASPIEITSAKSLGIYGLVVKFCGYFVEKETGEVYGDFRTIEKGQPVAYDAVVRGQSQKAADVKYVHPSKLTEMTVIGITQARSGAKPYIILTDKPRGAAFTTAAGRKNAHA